MTAAEPLFRAALDIRRKALPMAHPDVIVSLRALAEIYDATGRSELAVQTRAELAALAPTTATTAPTTGRQGP